MEIEFYPNGQKSMTRTTCLSNCCSLCCCQLTVEIPWTSYPEKARVALPPSNISYSIPKESCPSHHHSATTLVCSPQSSVPFYPSQVNKPSFYQDIVPIVPSQVNGPFFYHDSVPIVPNEVNGPFFYPDSVPVVPSQVSGHSFYQESMPVVPSQVSGHSFYQDSVPVVPSQVNGHPFYLDSVPIIFSQVNRTSFYQDSVPVVPSQVNGPFFSQDSVPIVPSQVNGPSFYLDSVPIHTPQARRSYIHPLQCRVSYSSQNRISTMCIAEKNVLIGVPIESIEDEDALSKLGIFSDLEEGIAMLYGRFLQSSSRPLLLGQKRSKYTPGLESVWNEHFSILFGAYRDDMWSFGPINPELECPESEGWIHFRDMAKVRFSCKNCAHGWTSMHGPVVFCYRFHKTKRMGDVRFTLTGQKCIECESGDFQTPMWYPEEARKVMTNLYYEISAKIYGVPTPPQIKDRRHGRPRQKHIIDECEGCHLGICKPKGPPPAEK